MSKKYPKDKESKHATVRLPREMRNAIEEFLKTETAKKMGYLHITDFVTAAVRELLQEYGVYKLEEVKVPIKKKS